MAEGTSRDERASEAATSIATLISVKLTVQADEITFCVIAKFHEDSLTIEGDRQKIMIAFKIAKSTKVTVTFDLSDTRNTSDTAMIFCDYTKDLLNKIVSKFGGLNEFGC
jgi:hypothetical protein